MLKQARETKGLSLETVHASTKIPMDILRALEEGYTVRTLTPFYYRGFVKIYAQYLGVDLAVVLGDYHPPTIPSTSQKTVRQSGFEMQSRLLHKQEKIQSIVKVIAFLLAFFVVVKVFGFLIHTIKNRSARAPKPMALAGREDKSRKEPPAVSPTKKVIAQDPSTTKATLPQAPSVPVVTVSGSADKREPGSGKNINLTVRAKKDSWLRVRADERVVFQATLNKGGVETWTAVDELEISGRNINQLEFEFNGRLLGPLGKENREVRKVVFTKDGLSVQK